MAIADKLSCNVLFVEVFNLGTVGVTPCPHVSIHNLASLQCMDPLFFFLYTVIPLVHLFQHYVK